MTDHFTSLTSTLWFYLPVIRDTGRGMESQINPRENQDLGLFTNLAETPRISKEKGRNSMEFQALVSTGIDLTEMIQENRKSQIKPCEISL